MGMGLGIMGTRMMMGTGPWTLWMSSPSMALKPVTVTRMASVITRTLMMTMMASMMTWIPMTTTMASLMVMMRSQVTRMNPETVTEMGSGTQVTFSPMTHVNLSMPMETSWETMRTPMMTGMVWRTLFRPMPVKMGTLVPMTTAFRT